MSATRCNLNYFASFNCALFFPQDRIARIVVLLGGRRAGRQCQREEVCTTDGNTGYRICLNLSQLSMMNYYDVNEKRRNAMCLSLQTFRTPFAKLLSCYRKLQLLNKDEINLNNIFIEFSSKSQDWNCGAIKNARRCSAVSGRWKEAPQSCMHFRDAYS